MKYEKSCGCIVLNKKNEILLVLHNAGHWGMPKGHVEEGETEKQTAIRETKEETNIEVKIKGENKYKLVYSPKENTEKEVIFFIAESINEQSKPQIEEVKEVKWFDIDKAIETCTYENSKDLLRQVKRDLSL